MPRSDQAARFTALVHDVANPLRRYVVRRVPSASVDDVVAEVLLVLWRRLDDVPTDDPLPWTYAVARGCVANARRAEQRRLRLVDRIGRLERRPGPLAPDASADASTDVDAELRAEVRAALARLRELDREVVTLWAWEGLAPREIATVTGLTANAVSIRLHKAKKTLARELGKNASLPGQVPDEGRRPR